MLRKICTLIALLASLTTHAQSPEVELQLGAKGQDVHLVWTPKNWPAGLQGYNLKRRVGDEAGSTLIRELRPSRDIARQLQTPGASFLDITAPMRRNFAYAHSNGFGHIDRFPAGVEAEVEYTLFAVMRGVEQPQPAASARWSGRDTVDLDIGLLRDKSGWDGTEAYFSLDMEKFRRTVTRYYVAEVRGNASRYVNSGRRPDLAPFEWSFVCHRPDKPDIEVVQLIAETRFGFQAKFDIPVARTANRTPSAASSRDCDPGISTPTPASTPSPATSQPGAPEASPPAASEPAVDAAALSGTASLWLDAATGITLDEGRVAVWRDKSGNGFVATMKDPQRRPTVEPMGNGVPAVHFDGRQSLHLERPLEIGAGTLFIVGRSGGHAVRNVVLGPVGSNDNNQLRWESPEGAMIIGPNHGSRIVQMPVGDTTVLHVLAVLFDGQRVGFWHNGRPSNEFVFPKPPGKAYSFNSIGSFFSQMYLTGDIAAIVHVPKPLTPPEIEAVDRHLRGLYRVR